MVTEIFSFTLQTYRILMVHVKLYVPSAANNLSVYKRSSGWSGAARNMNVTLMSQKAECSPLLTTIPFQWEQPKGITTNISDARTHQKLPMKHASEPLGPITPHALHYLSITARIGFIFLWVVLAGEIPLPWRELWASDLQMKVDTCDLFI